MFTLSDKLLDKPQQVNPAIAYLNLLYNKSQISSLVDISELRYVGSMKLDFTNELLEEEPETSLNQNKTKKEQIIQKQILVNLFKDI